MTTEGVPTLAQMLGQNSLASYAVAINPYYQIANHIDILIQYLEAAERGEFDRGIITMPPRHSKSMTATETFIPWWMGRHPDKKVVLTCNVQALATKYGGVVRSNLQSDVHQAIFPDCRVSKDTSSKSELTTTMKGELFAVGVGGSLPGRGGHLIVIDDPIKGPEEALSALQRKNLHDWYQSMLYNRQEPGACIIIVSTRWHEDDLVGWLLNPHEQEEVEDWNILSLPAIAQQDEGWRREGDALWPERWPLDKLQRFKRNSSQWAWTACYQGEPSAMEGMVILRKWWKRYHWGPHMAARRDLLGQLMTQPYKIVQSWDTALEDDEVNDFSVCETWLHTAKGEFLLDVWRRKVLMPELYRAAKELAIYWRAGVVLIERKASGHSLIPMMRNGTKLPIIACDPQGSKLLRMMNVSHIIEGGRCFLPIQAPWLKDFENELSAFPSSAKKDQVDATSQYLQWVTLELEREAFAAGEDQPSEDLNPYDQ